MFTLPFTLCSAKAVTPVSFIGSSGWSVSSSDSFGMTLPGGTADGDLLLAIGACDSSFSASTFDGPSTGGWTSLGATTIDNMAIHVYWKMASSETNPTFNFSGGFSGQARAGLLLAFRDADTPTVEASGSGNSVDPLMVSYTDGTSTEYDLIVGSTNDQNVTISVSPAGYTNSSAPFGGVEVMPFASFKQGAGQGTINWTGDFSSAPAEVAWQRIKIPPVVSVGGGAGNGPPTYIASNAQATGSGGGFNVSMPVTPQAGDIIVVVAAAAHQGGGLSFPATITGDTTYTTATNGQTSNNAQTGMSIHYTTAVGTESSINVSWGPNFVDFRSAAILIYRPTGSMSYEAAPTAATSTGSSTLPTSSYTDADGLRIVAWVGNATSSNTLNVSSGPGNGTLRANVDGSGFSQQDKELAVYDITETGIGATTSSLTWNTGITENVCMGMGLTDDAGG